MGALSEPFYTGITRIEGDKGRLVQIPNKPRGQRGRKFWHNFEPSAEVAAYRLGPGRVVVHLPRRAVLLLGKVDIWAHADGS